MHKDQLSKIRTRVKAELPGWAAQKLMSPLQTDQYIKPKPDSKQAGVVALLYPNADSKLQMVYIKRTSNHPNDKHGGQISFPGGQQEPSDENMQATALRELEEELGISAMQPKILTALTPIYVYISDFYVYPYLAYIDEPPVFNIEVAEVAYPITIPVESLMQEQIPVKDIQIRGQVIPKVPYYDLDGEVLWGATAMITSEIIALFKTM